MNHYTKIGWKIIRKKMTQVDLSAFPLLPIILVNISGRVPNSQRAGGGDLFYRRTYNMYSILIKYSKSGVGGDTASRRLIAIRSIFE